MKRYVDGGYLNNLSVIVDSSYVDILLGKQDVGDLSKLRLLGECQEPTDPSIERYYLSTDGFFFIYRTDKNNVNIVRASLYTINPLIRVDDIAVFDMHYGTYKKHHDVINYFEVFVSKQ